MQITPENSWVLQYFQNKKKCLLGISYNSREVPPDGVPPPCRSLRIKDTEDQLGVLSRTRDAMPAIHGAFTMYTALKSSWRRRCKARYCLFYLIKDKIDRIT